MDFIMRRAIRKIINILDGTPANYGNPCSRGQSTVELALITPLIIILLVGLVEIGWFANNYLILLEVSRVGARRGTVLTGDNSPLVWDDRTNFNAEYHLDLDPKCSGDGSVCGKLDEKGFYTTAEFAEIAQLRKDVRNCSGLAQGAVDYVGFYNLVLCQMWQSLDPLKLGPDREDGAKRNEDIVISVFSVQWIHNNSAGDLDLNAVAGNQQTYPSGYIPVVVGRYPATANECNWGRVTSGPNEGDAVIISDTIERDPFDYIFNDGNAPTQLPINWLDTGSPFASAGNLATAQGQATTNGMHTHYPVEVAFEVLVPGLAPAWGWLYDANGDEPPDGSNNFGLSRGYFGAEWQRGFNYSGYRRIESEPISVNTWDEKGNSLGEQEVEIFCYGSEFTVYDIEELMSASGFDLTDAELQEMRNTVGANFGSDGFGGDIDTRQFLVSQGIILVEIFWEHDLLLDFPAFSPVFNALGGDVTTISVWSAFPAPTAIPKIKYQRSWEEFCTADICQ